MPIDMKNPQMIRKMVVAIGRKFVDNVTPKSRFCVKVFELSSSTMSSPNPKARIV